MTFFWRALLKIKHVPEQLFDVFAFPIIGLLMFTYLFGGALAARPATTSVRAARHPRPDRRMITMYTGVGLNTDVTKGVFDRFRVAADLAPGDARRDAARRRPSLHDRRLDDRDRRPDPRLPARRRRRSGCSPALGLVLLFSFALAWVWTLVGLVAKTPQSVMGISMMVLFPLTFISNVFVDPETMPSWLQAFVEVNPVTLLVNAVRGCMEGDPSAGDIGIALACAAAIVAVFGPLTMRKYNQER